MKVLVINAGSSSVKYQFYNTESDEALAKGVVERIGMAGAVLTHVVPGKSPIKLTGEILDHRMAIEYVLSILLSKNHGVIKDRKEIDAVGHRVVHGGEAFRGSVRINDEVIDEMTRCIDFAPLHNPPNLKGISAAMKLLPDAPQVGVFDTAFHQTMPDYAYIYGIPYELYKRHGIRRYGFHGTSHRYVSRRCAKLMKKDPKDLKVITLHLGNGASGCAIDKGVSVDTSMGFTPLEGFLMGTRTGDLDPAILLHVMAKEELTTHEMNTMLNKHSGLLGISGLGSDAREIEDNINENDRAKLAAEVFTYRIKKYVGSYTAVMNGVDAVIFTGGIGENSSVFRKMILSDLSYLGIEIDDEKNKVRSKEQMISSDSSKVQVWVVPTNEELVIAKDTHTIVEKNLLKL